MVSFSPVMSGGADRRLRDGLGGEVAGAVGQPAVLADIGA
jgi:hypothetical protein